MSNEFGYAGVPVIVTGASSGMGAATARRLVALGADVTGVDVSPQTVDGTRHVQVDLMDPASIDRSLGALGRVGRLFNCAGLSGQHGPERVMKVNFLGARRLTEPILANMTAGDSVASISSTAGVGWQQNLDAVNELLGIRDFDEAWQWCVDHPEQLERGGYHFSKQCVIVHTLRSSIASGTRGIRMNCIGPGPTATPFLDDTLKLMSEDAFAKIPRPLGRIGEPEEQAEVMVWLNSDLASYVNGQVIWTDGGYTNHDLVGQP